MTLMKTNVNLTFYPIFDIIKNVSCVVHYSSQSYYDEGGPKNPSKGT